MLYDMAHPGAFFDSGKKAARHPFRAAMLIKGGHESREPFEEAGYLIGRLLFHVFEVQ